MTGDEQFEVLYRKFYWRIVRYYTRAFRLSEEDAKELAQDAFTRIYEAMDEYRGDAQWAFVETTARNAALNKIRAGKTLKRGVKPIELDDPVVGALNEPWTPAPQIDALRRKELREAIAQLPQAQRLCLRLRFQGFAYDEIARALRISLDAVKSRIRDAKRTLRAKLGDAGALPEDNE